MENIVGLKINLDSEENNVLEFKLCIENLLKEEKVKDLKKFKHHLSTTRLQHSINVSYYSYIICKKLGWDYKSAARGAMLHDLFTYDWRQEKQKFSHAFVHPKVALKNAKEILDLNKIEIDAIANHMWPLAPKAPRYKESITVSFADKYCAVLEVSKEVISIISNKIKFIKNIFKKIRTKEVIR